ncbi:MAG: VOC family protein [Paracoccus sp. (in: a-proteobacteria)]|nr:VOC family protein [Paracoccus sp. (in: a-proteobacteria)]
MIRPHVEIPVSSLDKNLEFYQTLFDSAPSIAADDFAEFTTNNPPMTLRVVERANKAPKPVGNNGHFGIQMKSSKMLEAFQKRFEGIGLRLNISQNDVECCGTVQNKIWVEDHDGNGWELFVVVDQAEDGGCGEDVESCTSCPCNFN